MLTYRDEIDGLRALAVASVIIYHARFEINDVILLKNGFIGVDIFFVISGFLIGRIILSQAENKNLSLTTFYKNRIRRILPVPFLVFFFTTPVGWYTLLPNDFVRLQESILTSVFFISNIFFQNISLEYGGQDSLLNPLVHTWSLSIEEQFYFLTPILVILVYKIRPSYLYNLLFIVLLFSFFYAFFKTIDSPTSSFFQFRSRAWEFIVGLFAAYLNLKRTFFLKQSSQIFIYLCGVLLILIAFNYENFTSHPGSFTMLPVLGTSLIILGSDHQTQLHLPFNNIITRYIGKISFSLYMWHYPIFSFYRNYNVNYTNYDAVILIVVTVIISIFSYEFFEQPMRRHVSSKLFKIIISFLLSTVLIIGLITISIKDFERYWISYAPSHLTQNYDLIDDIFEISIDSGKECHIKIDFNSFNFDNFKLNTCVSKFGYPIIILGDSHAVNVFNAISYSDKFNFIISFAQSGCRPSNCSEGLINQFDLLSDHISNDVLYNSHIIFHQSGSYLVEDANGALDSQLAFDSLIYKISRPEIEKIRGYLSDLSTRVGNKVIWLGPFVEYRNDPKNIVLRAHKDQSFSELMWINPNSISVFTDLENTLTRLEFGESDVEYISFDQFYRINPSAVVLNTHNQSCFQFRDRDHFSYCGEQIMSQKANWSIFGVSR